MPKSKLAEAIAEGSEEVIQEVTTPVDDDAVLAIPLSALPPKVRADQITKLLAEKKRKKAPTTRKVKKVFRGEHAVPPAGFRWAYNRLPRAYESMFDGMVYAFDPNEYRLLTQEVAYFLWSQSIVQYDPTTRRGIRALALDPHVQMEEIESDGFGEPMEDPRNIELFDRSGDPNPAGRVASGGQKTRPAVVSVSRPDRTGLPLVRN